MRLPPWVRRLAEYHRMRWWAARLIARAASQLVPGAEVYLVGSSVEGTSTIYSDIDVVVCIEGVLDASRARRLAAEILVRAMDAGLPLDYPVELRVLPRERCARLLARVKAVRVEPG